jgi:hypothetical protein
VPRKTLARIGRSRLLGESTGDPVSGLRERTQVSREGFSY